MAVGHPVYVLASWNPRNAILMLSPQIRGRDVDAPKYMRYTSMYIHVFARGRTHVDVVVVEAAGRCVLISPPVCR